MVPAGFLKVSTVVHVPSVTKHPVRTGLEGTVLFEGEEHNDPPGVFSFLKIPGTGRNFFSFFSFQLRAILRA